LADSVALVRCEGDPEAALREAIELIGSLRISKSQLVIKPNICAGTDKTGVANTKADIVESLITLILEENEHLAIRIVESDSMSKFADEAFREFGYIDLVERLNGLGLDVSLINLSQSTLKKVRLDGLYFHDPELPAVLSEQMSFALVAVSKTHGLTMVTGVLKNCFGLLPRKDKAFYHPHVNEVVVDMNRVAEPDLSCRCQSGIGGGNNGKAKTHQCAHSREKACLGGRHYGQSYGVPAREDQASR